MPKNQLLALEIQIECSQTLILMGSQANLIMKKDSW